MLLPLRRLPLQHLHRLIIAFLLGFSSGLPLGLTSSSLQAWYTVSGINLITIGCLGLLGQPYVYKFLWAPLLDRYIPPFLGRRRGWILSMQLLLIAFIAAMAFFEPAQHPWTLAILGLMVALFSATQDIAFNAYNTDIFNLQERGLGAACGVGGYRIAMLVSGGLSFVLADRIGWSHTYLWMAGLMFIGVIATLVGPEPQYDHQVPNTLMKAITEPFKDLWGRIPLVLVSLFIILYKLGDAFALTLTTPFLIRGLGFSQTEVGLVIKSVGLLATLLGVFVGGGLLNRLGMLKGLMIFGILQAVSNLCFMGLAIVGKNLLIMSAAIFLEQACAGLGTAAFLAFIMSLCNAKYTATQFALLSALSAVGRVFVAPLAGVLATKLGWVDFYLSTFFFALPGLLVLFFIQMYYHLTEQGLAKYNGMT